MAKRALDFFKKTDSEETIKTRSKQLDATYSTLKNCLHDPKFESYAKRYKVAEKETIDALIEYNEPDPVKYAMEVKSQLTKLRMARSLFKDLTTDVRKIEKFIKKRGANDE
jgi:hypothetical protein